jgi:YjbR
VVASAEDICRLALSLDGATAAPHFDRTAFKVARTFATLAADGLTANLKLTPDEQALKCLTHRQAFAPVPNAWGAQGWTTVTLARLNAGELEAALRLAWQHALPNPKTRSKRR